jgi:hypothetical protein
MEIDFPTTLNGDNFLWPPLFEEHLDGVDFFVKRAATEPKQASRNTRSGAPLMVGPERPEDLTTRYFNSVGWDDE